MKKILTLSIFTMVMLLMSQFASASSTSIYLPAKIICHGNDTIYPDCHVDGSSALHLRYRLIFMNVLPKNTTKVFLFAKVKAYAKSYSKTDARDSGGSLPFALYADNNEQYILYVPIENSNIVANSSFLNPSYGWQVDGSGPYPQGALTCKSFNANPHSCPLTLG